MHHIMTLSLLIAVLLLIRGAFRKKIHPIITYALWLVLVIKLCIPVSLFNVDLPEFRQGEATSGVHYEIFDSTYFDEYDFENIPSISPDTENTNVDNETLPAENESIKNEPNNKVNTPNMTVSGTVASTVGKTNSKIDVKSIFSAVWTVGAELMALCFISTSLIFAFSVRRDRLLIGKYKGIKVYVSERARTPCIFGIIPAIYLTSAAEESEDRELILLHEYTHLRHGDNFWSLVRMAALIFLWWNPLIWAAAFLSKQDGEIACDYATTRGLDTGRKKKYAYMLIDMIPKKPTLATGFANNSIKERIIMMTMTKKQKNNIFITSLAILLIIFAASCSFIGEEQGGESKVLFPVYEKGSEYEIWSIDYFKFDGENMYLDSITDKTAIDNLMDDLYSVKAEKSDGFKRGGKTVYGLRLNQRDKNKNNFDTYEYAFVDGYLIAKDGTSYEFDYDLTKIEKGYLETAPGITELKPEFPCLWHVALEGDEWNEYYLPTYEQTGITSNDYQIKMLRFFGEDLEFEYVDDYGHANRTGFVGTYYLRVLLGTKWYTLPYSPEFKPEKYVLMKSTTKVGEIFELKDGEELVTWTIDGVGHFKIPLETPTGYYRLSGGGYSHDIVINKDVRANIIDARDIGGIERIDSQIREIIPELYYGEPFKDGFVYSDYTLLGLERDGDLIRATVAICHRNYPNSNDPTEFIGRNYPAIITFKEENGKYVVESTISPEKAWKEVTKYFSEGIIISIDSVLEEHVNKSIAGAIEYYNIDANANIKALIDEAVEFYANTENASSNFSFKTYGGKLGFYGEYALKYLFEEYASGEVEGDYDEVLKELLPYVTGFNDKNSKSFSDLFERTYNLAEYETDKMIIKYSPVLSRLTEIIPSDRYHERYYINNPELKKTDSSPIQLNTEGLRLLFTYNFEKGNREYYFYATEGEPKRFKVGYKNEDGYLIPDTMTIPSQYKYEDAEPILMTYEDGELFYLVKLTYGDEVTYLKNICSSSIFSHAGNVPVPRIIEITAEEAERLLDERKG